MLIEEEVDKIMQGRGYSRTASIDSSVKGRILNYIKKVNALDVYLNANVELKSENIELSFGELKYFCHLSTGRFTFDHKDFAKYEQVMSIYASQLLAVDVFKILDTWKEKQVPESTELESRKMKFQKEISKIMKDREYPVEMCKKFFKYWTQMNTGGKKMQFEILKAKKGVFDVAGRLATWRKNDGEWAEEKIEKKNEKVTVQNKDLDSKAVDTKELF